MLATAEVRAMLERRGRELGWGERWEDVERAAARDFVPNPCGRLGRVEEVGALIAFVCSERAGYLNGADLRIDGGAADCV